MAAGGRWRLVSPPQKLGHLVVLLALVHDLEDPGGYGVVYHDHVAVGVVDLDGHAQVVPRLVLVGDLQRGLDRGVRLVPSVPAQLQGVLGVEASRTQLTGVPQAPEDGPYVANAVVVRQLDGDAYRVVYRVRLGLYPIGGHGRLLSWATRLELSLRRRPAKRRIARFSGDTPPASSRAAVAAAAV